MTEEFIDDIIAEANPANPEGDAAAKPVTEQIEKGQTLADPNPDAVIPEKETKKSGETTTEDDGQSGEAPTIEELATKLGWKPDHNGEDFVDASTFILRSREIQDSMREHNKELKNQLKNIQGSVDTLKEHNERVYKAEVSRMQGEIDRLRKERKAAIELADVDKVEELDGEINSIEKTLSEPKPKSAPSTNPVYEDWVQENSWYLENDEMAAYADTVAQQYAGAPLKRLYPLVRAKVAEVFPDYFDKTDGNAAPAGTLANPEGKSSGKARPVGPTSPVEASKKSGTTASFTKADLTAEQHSIMNQFVKSGIMTEEQYVKDIAKLQEA